MSINEYIEKQIKVDKWVEWHEKIPKDSPLYTRKEHLDQGRPCKRWNAHVRSEQVWLPVPWGKVEDGPQLLHEQLKDKHSIFSNLSHNAITPTSSNWFKLLCLQVY
jgi:hypothetical protein